MNIKHITKKNYTEEILNEEGLVLVDYWAPWCAPCKMLSPILEQIAAEIQDVKICKINVDEEPELAAEQMVRSIPMLTLVKDGMIINKTVGLRNKNEILAMIEEKKEALSREVDLKTAEVGE
jgi:thioredoxin 1